MSQAGHPLRPTPIIRLIWLTLCAVREWYEHAVAAGVLEPEAMALATASADGMPSVRFVLLKGIDARGVEFFTNYESRKACELIANPRAALAVLWKPLHRQVRLEGPVEVLTPEESDAYFATRSRGSQLGAWASRQSEVIPDREWLEARLARWTRSTRTRAAPAALGRLPADPDGDRVLGGPPEPPPRPRGVHRAGGRTARWHARRLSPVSGPTPQQPPDDLRAGDQLPRSDVAAARSVFVGRVVDAARVRVGDEREARSPTGCACSSSSTNSGAVQLTPTAATCGDERDRGHRVLDRLAVPGDARPSRHVNVTHAVGRVQLFEQRARSRPPRRRRGCVSIAMQSGSASSSTRRRRSCHPDGTS